MGPTNQQEAQSFKQISPTMSSVSSAVGWAISIGRKLKDGQQFDDNRLERVRSKLPGVEPRLCTAYTTLVFVVAKVRLFFVHSTYTQILSLDHDKHRYLKRQIRYT